MSQYRAQANHRLYLGRIVAAAWRDALDREQIPAATLAQAFEPAVADHLLAAYGWFLLEITQPDPAPARPPRGCAELPPPPQGKAESGEVREFRQLEGEGWLAELLRERGGVIERRQRAGNLAAAATPDPATLVASADRLQAMFDRMSDSLDEY